jgi:hypothetical protein
MIDFAARSNHSEIQAARPLKSAGRATGCRLRSLFFAGLFAFLFVSMLVFSRSAAGDDNLDLQQFVANQIGAGKHPIVIPPGVYRVRPKAQRHLFFNGLSDVEVVADGVEMICTETTPALTFVNCRNVTLRGMTIDYDPLPFTQGRITALPPDKSWVEFEIIPGYPETRLEERIEIFDPATRQLRRETASWSKTFESLGGHRFRIAKAANYHFDAKQDTEQVGDILVTNNRSAAGAGGHAISAENCADLSLQDVTLYAAECFGFIEHGCTRSTYLRCRIDRRPAASDLTEREIPRLRSLNADAFHSVEADNGPDILDCVARYQGDDCVNIHGTYHLVTAVNGAALRVAALGRLTIQPDDPVEFLPFGGARPPNSVVAEIASDGPITDQERDFVRTLHIDENNRRRLLDGKATFYRLTLDKPTELAVGSLVASRKRVGDGFRVRGCDFGYNRSRGILIKASRGEVSGNTIRGGWMAAVLIAPEYWWFESASSCDLIVQDNTISGCRRVAIEVLAQGGDGKPLASGAHRNLSITGNKISQSPWPNIHVTSTDNLLVNENRLSTLDLLEIVPPLADAWNWRGGTPQPIVTEFCDEAKIQSTLPATAN